jgi:hypothetical protein
MAIISQFEPRTGLVTLTVEGQVDGTAIKEALQSVVRDRRFRRGADMLWDFRGATGQDPSGGGIQDLVSFVGSLKEKRGSGYKVALVASGDLEYGFARMYEAYSEHLPFSLMVFRDLDEAKQWIASPLLAGDVGP